MHITNYNQLFKPYTQKAYDCVTQIFMFDCFAWCYSPLPFALKANVWVCAHIFKKISTLVFAHV